jgi:hypothetical protein
VAVSAEVAATITGKTDEIAATVAERTAEMAIVLSDKSGGVIAALTQKGQQFATEIGRATEEAVRSIENNGYAFTHAMLDNGSEITRMISTAGETASNSINRSLDDLHATAQKAIEQSKSTAASTVSEMMETHNMLRADTTALFERLREANIMLQEVLTGSHANMSALENTLMLRVSDFVTAMTEITAATGTVTTRVETNVADFRDVTARVVADLGQLAGQFDVHGRELASAAERIERSNQRADEGVGQRRAALEALVATLDARTEDIDQRLTRFSGLLDESLDAAAARAREIARVVSESTAEGSRAIGEQAERARASAEGIVQVVAESGAKSAQIIGEQYERIRAQADDERRRTAEAMRSIYDRSTAETHAMFSDASERFTETVQDMKRMAAEMQHELEATREELRRGTLELPQETAESTAQMRRVIVDQIEALAELNRIVARHGRNLDAVEPRRPQREDVAVVAAGSREPLPRPAPPRADVGNFAPAARRNEPPPPAAPPGAAASRNTGWLSEVLSRASREADDSERETARGPQRGPEERSPRHSIESLDSLSVDIARMIDHDAAADLWDRYKRGERNVFTRRLYTLQGQQAFDEIRKKYRSDREFKMAVDRYIGEFEQLLDEAARGDRGQLVARTYLTSETGKVYTMLAHAAGRFD